MLTIVIAVLGFLLIGGLGWAFVGAGDSRDKAVKRAQSFAAPEEKSRAKMKGASAQTAEVRRKQIMVQLKDAERRERKARVTINAKLRQAGLSLSVRAFWIISIVLMVVVMATFLLLGQKWYWGVGLGVAAGLGLPRWVVGFLAGRRVKKFTGEFPDAVDVIVRGIKSGLPVHDCFKIIGKEFGAPLGPEFQRLVENVGMGMTLEQALEKMYERMPTPELRFFTIVLSIQAKTGGNLAEALGNLSQVLRSRKLMREKVKAMSSEATASASIIGALPVVVMVIVLITTPKYMMVMFTDDRGHLMLLASGVIMGLGIFVMKRMISFKI
ncbi:MAG TPA: type II secretion system F family protein [Caulobacteraceae bacterium]|nr:type II secretion system F family protein [Caulobacteraceae bacterium]